MASEAAKAVVRTIEVYGGNISANDTADIIDTHVARVLAPERARAKALADLWDVPNDERRNANVEMLEQCAVFLDRTGEIQTAYAIRLRHMAQKASDALAAHAEAEKGGADAK